MKNIPLPTEKISPKAVMMEQSWIERRLGLASIQITSRANPLHTAKTERMRATDAMQFYHWYQQH